MTESDTVCCRNVLCRSICHRPSDSVRKDRRVGAASRSTQRGPLEFGITCECAHGCPCVVGGTSVSHSHGKATVHLHMFEDPSCMHVGTQISQQIHLLRVGFSS